MNGPWISRRRWASAMPCSASRRAAAAIKSGRMGCSRPPRSPAPSSPRSRSALGIAGGLLGWRLWPGIVLRQFPLFVIFLWAAAITAGYSYSGWFPDGFPRYFIPALFLFLMFLIMALRRVELRHGATWFLVSLCIAGVVANAATLGRNYTRGPSIHSYYGVSFAESKARFAREAAQFRIDGQPIFSDSVIDLYYPGVDWVS